MFPNLPYESSFICLGKKKSSWKISWWVLTYLVQDYSTRAGNTTEVLYHDQAFCLLLKHTVCSEGIWQMKHFCGLPATRWSSPFSSYTIWRAYPITVQPRGQFFSSSRKDSDWAGERHLGRWWVATSNLILALFPECHELCAALLPTRTGAGISATSEVVSGLTVGWVQFLQVTLKEETEERLCWVSMALAGPIHHLVPCRLFQVLFWWGFFGGVFCFVGFFFWRPPVRAILSGSR